MAKPAPTDICHGHNLIWYENERHRRKRTVYHFAPLAHFVARFRSTAPSDAVFPGRSKLRGIDPKRLN